MAMIESLINPMPLSFFLIMAVYFLLLAFIGYIAAKQTKDLKEYLIMGGRAGAIVSGVAYFATQYSFSTFMGVPAIAYREGFAGLSISVPGIAFSMIIPALVVGMKILKLSKKNQFLTMTDYLADRFQSNIVRISHALMIVVFLVAVMGAQMVGAGVIFKTFTGFPEWTGVVLTGTIVILYCMFSGMRGAMLTDVLQGLLMVITAIATFIMSIRIGGGLENITKSMLETNSKLLSHPGAEGGYGYGVYVSMILLWSFFSIAQPTLFTKFFTMKNYAVMFKAILLGTIGMFISATLIEWSGVNASISITGLRGNEADFIVPILIQQNFSSIISSILIAGIVSAGMSTVSALMVVATGSITRDIYQNIINPKSTNERILKLSRIITILIGLSGITIGICKPSSIFEIVRFAFGGMGVWAIAVILGMYWKHTTTAGILSGIFVAEIYYIYLKINKLDGTALALGLDSLITSWLLGMAVAITVSLFTKPVNDEVIQRHFE
ncbi:sodium:solute symporter [Taylorella equigenitalis]|nr:sodium:solute symporter [Taylorella equigenitalis]